MASQGAPDTIFYKALDRFKIGLNDREKEDFELTSLDEVHTIVLKIQDAHASDHKMQNMARIQSFLEGMEQLGNVIEVFLNVSVFVAFVWVGHHLTRHQKLRNSSRIVLKGPVKFLLQVSVPKLLSSKCGSDLDE